MCENTFIKLTMILKKACWFPVVFRGFQAKGLRTKSILCLWYDTQCIPNAEDEVSPTCQPGVIVSTWQFLKKDLTAVAES